jgi:hypothetical protein
MRQASGAVLRSLADVTDGELVQVAGGLFDVVRRICPTVGIHPGDTVTCQGRTLRQVLLRRTDGRDVSIDRFYASFIEVVPVAPPPTRASM